MNFIKSTYFPFCALIVKNTSLKKPVHLSSHFRFVQSQRFSSVWWCMHVYAFPSKNTPLVAVFYFADVDWGHTE